MRITPTREQMAYLASIGVSNETIAQPGANPASPLVDDKKAGGGPTGQALQWWAILLVIIAMALSVAGLAHGQEPLPGVVIRMRRATGLIPGLRPAPLRRGLMLWKRISPRSRRWLAGALRASRFPLTRNGLPNSTGGLNLSAKCCPANLITGKT